MALKKYTLNYTHEFTGSVTQETRNEAVRKMLKKFYDDVFANMSNVSFISIDMNDNTSNMARLALDIGEGYALVFHFSTAGSSSSGINLRLHNSDDLEYANFIYFNSSGNFSFKTEGQNIIMSSIFYYIENEKNELVMVHPNVIGTLSDSQVILLDTITKLSDGSKDKIIGLIGNTNTFKVLSDISNATIDYTEKVYTSDDNVITEDAYYIQSGSLFAISDNVIKVHNRNLQTNSFSAHGMTIDIDGQKYTQFTGRLFCKVE